ncbi:hypothetical protein [Hydrogenimonas sp.]
MMRWMAILFATVWLISGCGDKDGNVGMKSPDGSPVTFKPHEVTCPQCNMPLKSLVDSAQIVLKDGSVEVFDDPGCMVLWMDAHKIDPKEVKTWVYTRDTHRWIDAKKAHYSQTDPTPMGYGFGAYEKDAKDRISFERMRLRVLRGLTLKDPRIRKKLLGY